MFLRARVEPRPREGVNHVAEPANFTHTITDDTNDRNTWVGLFAGQLMLTPIKSYQKC